MVLSGIPSPPMFGGRPNSLRSMTLRFSLPVLLGRSFSLIACSSGCTRCELPLVFLRRNDHFEVTPFVRSDKTACGWDFAICAIVSISSTHSATLSLQNFSQYSLEPIGAPRYFLPSSVMLIPSFLNTALASSRWLVLTRRWVFSGFE